MCWLRLITRIIDSRQLIGTPPLAAFLQLELFRIHAESLGHTLLKNKKIGVYIMLDSAFISYVTVMSITPGPNNLLLAASGVNFGLRRTFPMMLGITFGCALQCALMTTLLAFILSWVGVVRLPLVTLGGGYLLWLSWKIFNSGTPNARDSEQPMGFIQGALFQAINPKAWLMAMNVAILFTPREGATLSHTLLIVGGFALLNLPCVAVWAVMGDQLRHALRVNWKLRLFNGVMGGLMAITALWLLADEWLTALA